MGVWGQAEGFFVDARKPELAVKMYRDARLWDDAIRSVCACVCSREGGREGGREEEEEEERERERK